MDEEHLRPALRPKADMQRTSEFHGPIDGHIVIPASHSGPGGSMNFNFGYPQAQDRPTRKCEPFSNVPFAPDPDFVDRPEILAWIRDKCARPGARAALVGLGGVGKSQLAIQYSYDIRTASPQIFLFWVHASTTARLEEAYRGIADRLELPGRHKPKVNVLRLVYDWLCDEANGRWMMILDNAYDIEVFYPNRTQIKDKQFSSFLTSLTDYLPQSPNGSILITSRSKDTAARLAGGYHNIYEICTFGEDQALQLLQNKLQDISSDESASDLLRTLDYIPLAITQAAAYINRHAPRITMSSYLDEFHKSNRSKEHLLNQDTGDLRRDKSASNSVVTAWQITFEHIRKERRSAADLLSLMSFFNPQGIPEFALRDYTQSLKMRVRNMTHLFPALYYPRDRRRDDAHQDFDGDIGVLQAYSLIGATAEKGIMKMHPLVQLCTRAWLSSSRKAEDWKLTFLTVMAREFPSGNLKNWAECKQLIPHLESFHNSEPAGKSLKKWVQVITDVGLLLQKQGKYNEAEKLNRRALEGYEKELGVQHPDTLASVNNLANVLQHQGKYDEAEKLNRRALEGREKELGVQHPDTLTSVYSLAYLLHTQKRLKEALKLYQRAGDGRKQKLGSHHPLTIACINHYSTMQEEAGHEGLR